MYSEYRTDDVKHRFTCRQLLVPTGGDWGGKKIDDAFFVFFETFFQGTMILERCSQVNPAALIELMEQWERLKCTLTLGDFLQGMSEEGSGEFLL